VFNSSNRFGYMTYVGDGDGLGNLLVAEVLQHVTDQNRALCDIAIWNRGKQTDPSRGLTALHRDASGWSPRAG
jgi:hypothetical protein